MNPADIFDDFCGPRWKRFSEIPADIRVPFEDQAGAFRDRISHIRRAWPFRRPLDIHADFIDDGHCNAWATVHGNMGLVGLFKGAILLPFEAFNRMLSHPLILPNVGKASLERLGAQHDEGLMKDYEQLTAFRRRQGRNHLTRTPKCSTRRGVAQLFTDLVWRFLAMHEIVHILHGHVDYYKSHYGASLILESDSAQYGIPKTARIADLQTMELWADMIAARVVFDGFIKRSPNGIFTSPSEKLFIWSFALFTLFRIFSLSIDLSKLSTATHPPSVLRFTLLAGLAADDIATAYPEIAENAVNIVHAGQVAAEQGIRYSGEPPLDQVHMESLSDPAVRNHRDFLVDHFDRILRNNLMKHAYVELNE